MIDHVSIPVSDLTRSGRFYDAVLAPLGIKRIAVRPRTIGFGKQAKIGVPIADRLFDTI